MIIAEPQHMDPGYIIAIIAIVMSAAVVMTWIRAKHGYPIGTRGSRVTSWIRALNAGTGVDPDAERKIALLSAENEKLIGRIGRLEERIAVLERIVTDPGHATARAIEELR